MSSKQKTLLFCTSYVADAEAWRARYQRWINHHRKLVGEDCLICLIDDGSPYLPPERTVQIVCSTDELSANTKKPFMFRFEERLGRGGILSYPGWWRSFLSSVLIAKATGCNKIIHVESDAYVLTRKMLKHLYSLDAGWWAAWCDSQGFPESALQVICADQFGAMQLMQQVDPRTYENRTAERALPFTGILRQFEGDRYSEFRRTVPKGADFAVQILPEQKIWIK